jgi:succinate dehydrogenase/fumarate reductase flavoprotein subunit
MAIGAALWGTANQTNEAERCLRKAVHIGSRFGYASLHWPADSKIFHLIRGSGLTGVDWTNAIMVNQTGRRFYNEEENSYAFIAAAMAYSGDPSKRNGGGPIWAVFDAEAVARQKWDPTPPNVDVDGYFFSGDTIVELAGKIVNPYQSRPMPAATLQETVTRYNSFVDAGKDADFEKPAPFHKIQTPPFYAAWATPLIHDSYSGLRTNTDAQVIDTHGQVIPGLYCSGECQGGFNQHGLGRATVFGRIAGRHAALYGDQV